MSGAVSVAMVFVLSLVLVSCGHRSAPVETHSPRTTVPAGSADGGAAPAQRPDSAVAAKPTDDTATEWGTERDGKGDPYIAGLKGRIISVWRVPALAASAGTTLGCVRLRADGTVQSSELRQPSANADFNRSVAQALDRMPAMDQPVPAHLQDLLTVRGVCFKFVGAAQ